MEACLEDIARDALLGSMRRFKSDGSVRRPLVAVSGYFGAGVLGSEKVAASDFIEVLERAVGAYVSRLKTVNGVRERDLHRVLYPVGIVATDIDPVWLAEIDSFGKSRGDVAHQSVLTQRPPDPVREKQLVARLVTGIGTVDRRLQELVK
ncbi:MAG TPA: hypothetical protein VGK17_03615 [Propionicimonas sp.]|jgi:hypothetical protein